MKNILSIVTLVALLSACATVSRPVANADGISPIQVASASTPASTELGATARKARMRSQAAGAEDSLPSVKLTEDLLFKYLTAEFADQRGEWQLAYTNMLVIAQETRDPRVARRAAEIALNAKQSKEALAAVRLWREITPHSEEATQYYLGLAVLGDNIAEAKPYLQQRLNETRSHTLGLAILQTQRLLSRAKDKHAAFSLLEDLLGPYQSLPETHIALAQSAFAAGNNSRAVQEAKHALKLAPDSELAVLTLAQVLPDKSDTLKTLSDFLSSHPKAREIRLAYARMLVEQKQYAQAVAEFKTLLKEQPQDLTVLYALGLLSAQNNNLKEAEQYLTTYMKVLGTQPDDERDPTQALIILTQIAEERNDIKSALKWLEQVDSTSSNSYLNVQIKRAQLIAKSGDLSGARKLLKELNGTSEEEQVQALAAEAQILKTANHAQEAMSVLENGLKKFPDNVDLLYDYAMAAEKLNNLTAMETSLRKVIKLAPNNQHAYNALGYSFAERNIRLEEAYMLIEKALQLAPEDPFIMDSMGWVQFRLGRLREAEAMLRRAYELRPDAEIATHLGEVLWVKGQQEDAKKLWRDANIKDPKNDTLKNTLGRFQVKL